jgi:ribosomal protein L37E
MESDDPALTMREAARAACMEFMRATQGAEPSVTCPRCGMESFNENDVIHAYCGFCHKFHTDMQETETHES